MFDGIRMTPGWVGAGLSFLTLARHCVENGHRRILVMEDDVILPQDFDTTLDVVEDYLDNHAGNWDSFSGLIADLHRDANILEVTEFRGITFATIDKMTSTVFNYYSIEFMRKLLLWNSTNMDSKTNTIDRFIESTQQLRVIVALPYLAGHREDVNSVLWGFNNETYSSMIAKSEKLLEVKVNQYKEL